MDSLFDRYLSIMERQYGPKNCREINAGNVADAALMALHDPKRIMDLRWKALSEASSVPYDYFRDYYAGFPEGEAKELVINTLWKLAGDHPLFKISLEDLM
jgi:hypothetical protein